MKLKFSRIALFAVVSVLAVSCGSGDKSGPAIPKDASVVVHINSGSLTKKLSWEEIKASNWFKEAYANADDSLAKKLMDNPAASGIDIEKDLVFFVKKQGNANYMVFEGSVKDAKAFEAFNKQIIKGASVTKAGDLSVIKIDQHDQNGLLTFNESRFVYISNAPGGSTLYPPLSQLPGNNAPQEQRKISSDSLQMFATQLYDLPSSESIYKDDRFAATMKETGDMHVWINNEQAYGGLAAGMLGMMKLNVLVEKNATGMTLNFDNGKIAVKTKQYFNDQVLKVLEKYPAKDISADVVNRIPSQNVVAAFVMNYPPEGLKEFLKLTGLDGTANAFLSEVGYSIDEFVKANKGDLVVAISDIQPKPDSIVKRINDDGIEVSENKGGTDMKFLFATSVNDKASFDKMIGIIGSKVGEFGKDGPVKGIEFGINDKWFVTGNSKPYVDQFLAGGNSKQPFTSRISGQPFGMFIDLQKAITSASTFTSDSSAKAVSDASLKMWQDIVVTGGKVKDGGMSYEAEINLVDKSTNSLKQLNKYFDVLSLHKK
ncbi:MAG: DUF4836 family protein [Chitinophagaceae bacterium]|nr:MAG: DUF4836 family protein [Chitinophagaceae bacterium]